MGYLREAVRDDMDLLFQWANESTVRQNSFSTADIAYDEHVKWFENILKNKNIKQYIYVNGDESVGQVRITVDSNEAIIAYSISKEKRCMGFGKEMLRILEQKVKHEFPEVEKLVAKVKPDNIASKKVFSDMGFEQKYYVYELAVDKNVKE